MEQPCPSMTFEERVAYIEENWPILLVQTNFIVEAGESPPNFDYLYQYCKEPRKHKSLLDQVCDHIYVKSREAQSKIDRILVDLETN